MILGDLESYERPLAPNYHFYGARSNSSAPLAENVGSAPKIKIKFSWTEIDQIIKSETNSREKKFFFVDPKPTLANFFFAQLVLTSNPKGHMELILLV